MTPWARSSSGIGACPPDSSWSRWHRHRCVAPNSGPGWTAVAPIRPGRRARRWPRRRRLPRCSWLTGSARPRWPVLRKASGRSPAGVVGLLAPARRAVLRAGGATIDLDGTDVEVYGSKKEGIAYNYKGQRGGRPHVATWAEAGVVTAADLLAGDEDPRPGAGSLIERSVATLRAAGVSARPKVRGDVGYFAKDIAWAAVDNGCDFSLGVTRNPAAWRP